MSSSDDDFMPYAACFFLFLVIAAGVFGSGDDHAGHDHAGHDHSTPAATAEVDSGS